jgi:hypothetical protein
VSVAEWAELAAAFPADSKTSREVRDWLRSWQLPSGAFPLCEREDPRIGLASETLVADVGRIVPVPVPVP